MIPVLHMEAHGGNDGLEGPDGSGGSDLLNWDALTLPLHQLNLLLPIPERIRAAENGFPLSKRLLRYLVARS
jgi:hypothetical protein